MKYEIWLTESVLFAGPLFHVESSVSHHFMTSFTDLSRAAATSEQHHRHAAELESGPEGHVNERVFALGEGALVGFD